ELRAVQTRGAVMALVDMEGVVETAEVLVLRVFRRRRRIEVALAEHRATARFDDRGIHRPFGSGGGSGVVGGGRAAREQEHGEGKTQREEIGSQTQGDPPDCLEVQHLAGSHALARAPHERIGITALLWKRFLSNGSLYVTSGGGGMG